MGCLGHRKTTFISSTSNTHPGDGAPRFRSHPKANPHGVPLPPGTRMKATKPPLSLLPCLAPVHACVCVCASRGAPRAHLGLGFSRDKGMLISSLYCSLLSWTSSHAWTWHSRDAAEGAPCCNQPEPGLGNAVYPAGRGEGGEGGEGNKSITPRSLLPASPAHCERSPRQKFPVPPAGCLVPSLSAGDRAVSILLC